MDPQERCGVIKSSGCTAKLHLNLKRMNLMVAHDVILDNSKSALHTSGYRTYMMLITLLKVTAWTPTALTGF